MKSTKPKKQRIAQKQASLHARKRLLGCHLSKELQKKYEKRTVTIRKGDKVKVMAGQFKTKTGKIEEINTKTSKVFINGVEFQKKDGTKIRVPVHVSNIMITELNLDDKKRQEILKRK